MMNDNMVARQQELSSDYNNKQSSTNEQQIKWKFRKDYDLDIVFINPIFYGDMIKRMHTYGQLYKQMPDQQMYGVFHLLKTNSSNTERRHV